MVADDILVYHNILARFLLVYYTLFMATTYPYKKPRYAWEYLVFVYALSKTVDTKLPVLAKDLTLDSLRLRLFQGRKFIEDDPSCDILRQYQQLVLTTSIRKFGIAQLIIVGDLNFSGQFSFVQGTQFFTILNSIDAFISDKDKTSFTYSSTEIPAEAWASIGFYVDKVYNFLRVKTAFSTSIFLRK